mgnify:CR=1 FL=1
MNRIILFCLGLLCVGGVRAYADRDGTATPIRHLVVIFQENVSFDHYFGTYPKTLTGPDGRFMMGSVPRQFVTVGICGGFTTFSSFSLQTLNLMNDGEWLRAGANIGGSVVGCLVAVWAGQLLAASISSMKWI